MNRILAIIFVILLLFITAEAGFLLFLNHQPSNLKPPPSTIHPLPSTLHSPSPNSSLPSDFKILYQEPDDEEGRTIIYESKTHKFSGVGEFYDYSTSPARLTHIIGIFERWEEIPGSKDKYLILSDPINKKTLQKTRVAFERSEFFGNGVNATVLAIEHIKENQVENTKKQIFKLSKTEREDLIKKGDVVIVHPLLIFNNKGKAVGIKSDNNDVILVNWLTLRRSSKI